jgi:hypothetical protein
MSKPQRGTKDTKRLEISRPSLCSFVVIDLKKLKHCTNAGAEEEAIYEAPEQHAGASGKTPLSFLCLFVAVVYNSPRFDRAQ